MLVNSVVIVVREVLEAALLVSVLLALSRRMQIPSRWLAAALLFGLAGAIAYARLLQPISDWFEGVGQELTNAALQLGVFAGLALIVYMVAKLQGRKQGRYGYLPLAMAATVALAISREGSEIIIFVSGFLRMESLVVSVSLGSLLGAAIGGSAGVLLYYLLLALPERRASWISLLLLCLASASMCSQAIGLMIQADWIAVSEPLWDSSGFIAEQSIIGQLLYALIGYEASPTAIEVFGYVGSIAAIVVAAGLGRRRYARQQGGVS